MTGAEYVVKCLEAEGITQVYGYPGGAVIPLYDALYGNTNINHIRTCHEQAAGHAADGYARATGKVGVCIATSGPGATNVVTSIATAHMDSVPMVVITGQVGTGMLGKDSFQEVDIVGISKPITKSNVLVKYATELPEALSHAFYTAKEGRPGVVLVDITKTALLETLEEETYERIPVLPFGMGAPKEEDLQELVKLFNESKRPLIYAGGGVVQGNHSEALSRFAESKGIPVCSSLMGLGNIDRRSPYSYGMVGMHGEVETNHLCYNADLIVGIGVRFSDRAIGHRKGLTNNAKIVHIDVDPKEFTKNLDSCLHILGNYTEVLNYLDAHVHKQETDWSKKEKTASRPMHPRRVMKLVADHMPKDTVVVTDVGQHQMWAAMYWPIAGPRKFITSGGLGTMGYCVPACMGVKHGVGSEVPVLGIVGDGGFRMSHGELLTMVKHGLDVTFLLINNHSLGMVRQWQALFGGERYAETDIYDQLNMEYLCKAYGASYVKVTDEEGLADAIDNRPTKGINIIECMIDHDERVYPIVPAGKGVLEYIVDDEEA